MRIRLCQAGMLPLAAVLWVACGSAQSSPVASKPQAKDNASSPQQQAADAHKLPAERGDVVDRLVAIVNGDIILQSDIEEEERFSRLYPYRITSGETEREQAMTRLIDRDLILQQIRGTPPEIPTAEIDKDESDLRKDLPACAAADCASAAGWQKFLANSGFTEEELRARIRLRAEVLRFIEQRFRTGIRITDKQIADFYTQTMLPQYAKEHAVPPPLAVVSPRIEEVLLQQQVSALLDQWLKTLRDGGSVRILKDGEEAP